MTRIVAFLLSFFLVYAGAAQLLAACLAHNENAVHHSKDHHSHSHSHAMAGAENSRNPFVPVIHCPSAEQQLGPAVPVASTKISRLDQVTPIHAPFVPEMVCTAFRNSLWLEAVFKRILTFSLPNDLARHLFLSVIQI